MIANSTMKYKSRTMLKVNKNLGLDIVFPFVAAWEVPFTCIFSKG